MQTNNPANNVPYDKDAFVVTQDILARFPVTSRTIQDWRSRHNMPYYKIGKTIFYRLPEVIEFIERFKKGK